MQSSVVTSLQPAYSPSIHSDKAHHPRTHKPPLVPHPNSKGIRTRTHTHTYIISICCWDDVKNECSCGGNGVCCAGAQALPDIPVGYVQTANGSLGHRFCVLQMLLPQCGLWSTAKTRRDCFHTYALTHTRTYTTSPTREGDRSNFSANAINTIPFWFVFLYRTQHECSGNTFGDDAPRSVGTR